MLAEEHRDGANTAVAIAETPAASGSDSADEAGREWVDRRIEELGDPVYGVRAKATRQLIAAGPRAVERLSFALVSRDAEVARRSRYILERVIQGDRAGFQALETIARLPEHPAATIADAILQSELDRRDQVLAAMAENRRIQAHRMLREARSALYQGRFEEAREKALAAEALEVTYKLFDDRPDLVLNAIRLSEAHAQASKPAPLATAERE